MIGDFGSGSGHFAIAMAKIIGDYGKILAVDVREISLEFIRSRAKMENLSNIDYIRANLEINGATGIANGALDLVILITVLSQSNKKEEILKEALRTLKRDGKLLIVEWVQTGPAFASSHEYRITKEEMQKITEGAGFKLDKELDVKSFHYGLLFTKQ